MDGHELARRLRAAEADVGAVRTPIVAVTADAMKGEEERCFAAGMDAYLVKPVSVERLRATLERWLPVQAESSTSDRPDQMESTAAIDRNVLGAWLGEDRIAIDGLLAKFRRTAVEAEREINVASRGGERVQHKLRENGSTAGRTLDLGGAAQSVKDVASDLDRGSGDRFAEGGSDLARGYQPVVLSPRASRVSATVAAEARSAPSSSAERGSSGTAVTPRRPSVAGTET